MIWIIFHKEMIDTIRDRKTLLINLALPVLIWPLTAMFVSQYAAVHTIKQEAKQSRIVLIEGGGDRIRLALVDAEKIDLIPVESNEAAFSDVPRHLHQIHQARQIAAQSDTGADSPRPPLFARIEAVIRDHDVDCVVAVDERSVGAVTNSSAWILHDGTDPDSAQAARRVKNVLDTLQIAYMNERLDANGLDSAFLDPLVVHNENIAGSDKTVRDVIGRILPLILIVLVVLGGFYPAINMTAGEKEYGTLPTLLCAPVHHLELLLGKYLAILLIALVGVAINVLSLSVVTFLGLAGTSLNLSPLIVIWIFLSLVPTAMLYTALFMSVAIFANSFREGQNLLSPVTLVAVLPAYAALLPGVELNALTAVTPGFNIALLIRDVLVNPVNPEFIAIALIANLGWTAVILMVAAKIFASEQVLLSDHHGIGELLALDRDMLPYPDSRSGTVLFIVFLSGTFYLSGILLPHGIAVLIPVLQLGLFVAVPVLFARYFRMPIATVFRLRRPGMSALAGAVVLGATLFVTVNWLAALTPAPEAYKSLLTDALQLRDPSMSLPILIVLIAILPGVCEEIAFRGIMLSGYLTGFRPRYAVAITALWFACAHFNLYNFLSLLAMGFVLGYCAWRTGSIWPGVIVHVMNNGLAVFAVRHEDAITASGIVDVTGAISTPAVGVAILLNILGVGLIHMSGRPNVTDDGLVPHT